MSARRAIRRRRDSGVTLVEILVSLSIIGAVASLAMLAVRPASTGSSVEMEARRLAGLLDLAAGEALTTGGRIVFEWDGTGYAFLSDDTDLPGLTGRKDLGRGIGLDGDGDTPARLIGGAFSEPVTLTLGAGEARWRVDFDGVFARATRSAT